MNKAQTTRRTFLKATGSAAGLLAAGSRISRAGESSKKHVIGMIGCGGRGTFLRDFIIQRPDVDVRYLCDIDENRIKDSLASFGKPTAYIKDDKPLQTRLP